MRDAFRLSAFASGVLFLLLFFSSCGTTLPGAVMQLQNDSLNITMTHQEPVQTFYFDFRNAGSEVLRVEDIRVSCNCMKVEVDPMEVPSRGKGRVKVVLNLTNAYPMVIDKKIGIYTNDAQSPAVIKLTGEFN